MIDDRPDILESIEEIIQSRSRFQLERFVLGQHDTIEMAFQQVCMELRSAIFSWKRAKLRRQQIEIEVARLKESDDEVDHLEARIKELDLEEGKLQERGTLRELNHLIDMYDQFPHKFTYDELEAAQPAYWQARLGRQAELQAIGQGKVDWAQLNAIHQAGFLPEFVEKTGITSSEKKELGNA
jgi:hypothetical protein